MNPIELVEQSELWTKEWGIPAFHPQTNQPHLNTAIVFRCVGDVPDHWMNAYNLYRCKCMFFTKSFDVCYSRKPNRDQNLSKDEAVGLASIESNDFIWFRPGSENICRTLDNHFNIYPNELGEFKLKRWWGRHIHIKPFLRTVVNPQGNHSTLGWRTYIRWQMLTQKAHNFKPEKLIQTWLTGPAMSKIPECKVLYEKWCEVMNGRGINPNMIFDRHWMRDAPTLKLIAPKEFK